MILNVFEYFIKFKPEHRNQLFMDVKRFSKSLADTISDFCLFIPYRLNQCIETLIYFCKLKK